MTATQNDSLPNERWLPVVGYEGIYDVSDCGQVRRMKAGPNTFIGKILIPQQSGKGYLRVILYKDGTGINFSCHRLVAAAFIGPCPEGKQINHSDCNKTNNTLINLEYVTGSENIRHAYKMGTISSYGEKNGGAKLTEKSIHIIRSLLGIKTHKVIAMQFGVCRSTIGLIANKKNWAWLDAKPVSREG